MVLLLLLLLLLLVVVVLSGISRLTSILLLCAKVKQRGIPLRRSVELADLWNPEAILELVPNLRTKPCQRMKGMGCMEHKGY